jgi:membrane protease subunit (stomatin/prohibitin family)
MMGTTTKIEASKTKQDDSAAITQAPQANQSAQLAPQQVKSSSTPSITDRLTSLNELKAKGLITQKDYDLKKAELLKGM